MHLFEDLAVVEVVDADCRPVPDGEVGDQILVTSLDNHTQPTIRLAVSDRVALDPEPCPCGRQLRLLRAVEGRSDDIIHLPSPNGRTIAVHPMQFAPVAKAREVREFQIVQDGPALNVRVVLHSGAARPRDRRARYQAAPLRRARARPVEDGQAQARGGRPRAPLTSPPQVVERVANGAPSPCGR